MNDKPCKVADTDRKTIEGYEVHKLTDIKIASFLLIHKDSFELVDVERVINNRSGKRQCEFFVANKSEIPIKRWLLDYMNDNVKVSVHAYSRQLDDLRDVINCKVS